MEQETVLITRQTTIGEIVDTYPQTIETLLSYGVHCVGCHVSPFESLEDGFRGHGLQEEQIDDAVQKLNEIIKNGPSIQPKEPKKEIDLKDAKIIITEKAAAKIKEFLEQEKQEALRVSVHPGGCSGFSYGMELDSTKLEGDFVFEEQGIKVFVDKASMAKLNGARIDFVESLQATGFKIDNPQATSSCGCGNSFG